MVTFSSKILKKLSILPVKFTNMQRQILYYSIILFSKQTGIVSSLTLKEPGGGRNPPPLRHFFVISLPVVIFFALKLLDFFPSQPCARFKTIFIKIGPRVYDAALCNSALGTTKNWFSIEITHKSCFLSFLSFRIHFHYVLSYLFGLFGVRTCVSILWHTSLLKNATFAWKNSKKTMILAIFGDFRVFDMTSLMTSLWRHTRYVLNFFDTNELGRVIAIH